MERSGGDGAQGRTRRCDGEDGERDGDGPGEDDAATCSPPLLPATASVSESVLLSATRLGRLAWRMRDLEDRGKFEAA
eukprot:2590029-Rhodomonas_salina.1